MGTCKYLYRRARDAAGKVLTVQCAPCGNKELDLFECTCPERRDPVHDMNDIVTLNDCKTCGYKTVNTVAEVAAADSANLPIMKTEQPPVETVKQVPKPRALILRNHLSPGDVLVMTAAVYALHKAHPGRFLTAVDTTAPAVWEHNPDVKQGLEDAEVVACHYPAVHRCNQEPIHMLLGYSEFLAHALQVPVPLCINRPVVYVSDEEKGWLNQVQEQKGYAGKFWLINSGIKQDFRAKLWPWYQELVDLLQGEVQFVQVGSLEHLHKPLRGVINLIGQTDQRQLVRLCYHAQGVVCGTTFLMHLAAALQKPAVVLAGGREPKSWNTYPFQTLLNNVGALSCTVKNGKPEACWKSRVVLVGDGQEQDNSLCEQPVLLETPVGKCMTMIKPGTVADAVRAYYLGGVLSH